MTDFKRWRVRATSKTYKDDGPDLLRPEKNARIQFAASCGSNREGWHIRRNPPGDNTTWTEWNGPMRKAQMLDALEVFQSNAPAEGKFQAGRKVGGKVEPKAEMLTVRVADLNLPQVNPGAALVANLAKEQFPDMTVLGFDCKHYNNDPREGWSDHAWGDAVDLIRGTGNVNDVCFDWCLRMAREGCMGDPDQLIGSRDGRVYNAVSPRYSPVLGGPSSHLFHVHCSYVQHYGAYSGC